MSNVTERTLLVILAALMAFGPLSIDMYLPAFASIAADFAVSTARVELSLASFFVGLALGQLLHGSLSDRFGRRPVVLVGLGLYVVACVACALAPSVEFLIDQASARQAEIGLLSAQVEMLTAIEDWRRATGEKSNLAPGAASSAPPQH